MRAEALGQQVVCSYETSTRRQPKTQRLPEHESPIIHFQHSPFVIFVTMALTKRGWWLASIQGGLMNRMGRLIAALALCVLALSLYAGSNADAAVQSLLARLASEAAANAPVSTEPGGGIPSDAEYVGSTTRVEGMPGQVTQVAMADAPQAQDLTQPERGGSVDLSQLVSRETVADLLEWVLVLLVLATIADAVARAVAGGRITVASMKADQQPHRSPDLA